MQYKLVMFLSKVACHTPYRLLMAVGWVLGNLYYLLIKKERERAVSQMMPALGIEEPEARHLVRLSFINLARNVLEILYMPHLSEKNFGEYIEIDHLERLPFCFPMQLSLAFWSTSWQLPSSITSQIISKPSSR